MTRKALAKYYQKNRGLKNIDGRNRSDSTAISGV